MPAPEGVDVCWLSKADQRTDELAGVPLVHLNVIRRTQLVGSAGPRTPADPREMNVAGWVVLLPGLGLETVTTVPVDPR
jgi:hypothetical protein